MALVFIVHEFSVGLFIMITAIGKAISSNRIVFSRILAIILFLLILFSGSKHEGSMVSNLLFIFGLSLVGVGTIGRLWCSLYISGHKDSKLISSGPYSISRNPLYLFSFIGFIGFGLATETVTFPLIFILIFAFIYKFVIKREETFLRSKYGKTFEAYCQKVPYFFPNFKIFEEPETYTVNPRLFRRTMTDVIWFIWILGIIKLFDMFQEYQIIEPLFYLW